MTHTQQMKLDRMRWKFHEQSKQRQELIDRRKKILEASYTAQIKNERDALASRIYKLQPGPRVEFLKRRLHKLNEKLINK